MHKITEYALVFYLLVTLGHHEAGLYRDCKVSACFFVFNVFFPEVEMTNVIIFSYMFLHCLSQEAYEKLLCILLFVVLLTSFFSYPVLLIIIFLILYSPSNVFDIFLSLNFMLCWGCFVYYPYTDFFTYCFVTYLSYATLLLCTDVRFLLN